MADIYDQLSWLEKLSVRFRPKSEDVFEKLMGLSKQFENLSAQEQVKFISTVPDATAKKMLSLSAFLAEHAMSTKSEKWLVVSLLLHVMEDFRKDYRENFRYLVLIAYASSSLSVPVKKLVSEVLPIASSRANQYLNDFLSRDDELNQLDKFGLKLSTTDGAPRFVPA